MPDGFISPIVPTKPCVFAFFKGGKIVDEHPVLVLGLVFEGDTQI